MRSIWSGSIAFGLINIPVRIYSASEERTLKFRLLDRRDFCPVSYAKVCRATNREIPYEEIVRGYEYQKGDYVILTDDDFKKVAPKKTKTIDIIHFTEEDDVPSKQIDKPYFIEPDAKAQKAYALLREALRKSKKVGIASWVLRNREHIAMIRPEGKVLMLIGLRYAEEMRSEKDLDLPAETRYSKRELEMALSLIEQLTESFDVRAYRDTYTDELLKIIKRKANGQTIKMKDEGEPVPTDMRDLMSALKRSLEHERRTVRARAGS